LFSGFPRWGGNYTKLLVCEDGEFCYLCARIRKSYPYMKGIYTILMLVVSNLFMTFAWYGHLKLQEMKVISHWPLYAVILFSWAIALAEYSFQVPANRIGFEGNGGPFSLMQLKVIQEVVTLLVFTLFSTLLFKGESLHWNHLAAFICLIMAVYFVFYK
jgi:uncharacterized protein (DUF486 family)